jgi:hypothetical protein
MNFGVGIYKMINKKDKFKKSFIEKKYIPILLISDEAKNVDRWMWDIIRDIIDNSKPWIVSTGQFGAEIYK